MNSRYGDISVEISEDYVATVTIHRPPNNYISRVMTRDLGQALADLDSEPRCRAILLQSEGKHFCAGALHDPDDPKTMEPDTVDLNAKWDATARLFSNTKPIVAAVQGAVIGAGFGLVMLADFRVASTQARFSANFVKIGFCPGFGLPVTLPRVIGAQRASWMFMTGRRFTAEEVQPWGLVDILVAPDQLAAEARALAAELAGNAPLGMQATRARMRDGLGQAVRAALAIDSPEQTRLRHTEDHHEGVLAYRERRPAAFQGR